MEHEAGPEELGGIEQPVWRATELATFDVPIESGPRHAGHKRGLNDGEGGHGEA